MYGIINKSIESLVKENFGQDKWELIKQRSGTGFDFFVSTEPYDDDITYKLASSISEEMSIPLNEVFKTFGEWWILRTSKEKYGSLIEAGGNNLREFLINLPVFHNRVMLIYPKLTPPEFKVSEVTEKSLLVHYYSQRHGLQDFVFGLLTGLGKLYETKVDVTLIQEKKEGGSHDIFKVSW